MINGYQTEFSVKRQSVSVRFPIHGHMFCTIKSRNDMKAVETMEIKVLIVSKSTYDHLFIN